MIIATTCMTELPRYCIECQFCRTWNGSIQRRASCVCVNCYEYGKPLDTVPTAGRQKWCPLREVPDGH